MDQQAAGVLAYISAHPELAALVVGLTSFGESFAFVNFIVPGGAVLIGAGMLVHSGVLDPVSILLAAVAGAVVGDAISYGIGWKFGTVLPRLWPFRKHPEVLERGVQFFKRYGQASVFIGRFFGPLRAVVPTTAGIVRMSPMTFMVATFISALIWAPVLMFAGILLDGTIAADWSIQMKVAVIASAVIVVILAIYAARRLFHVRYLPE